CEAEIQQALAALARGRTVLAIGHHAESVAGADVICVMENGGIAACGSSEELADQPYWARLSAGRAMEGATR
ncbi:ABC transporter ATP-binding protein, partial [Cutibacterium acnes]